MNKEKIQSIINNEGEEKMEKLEGIVKEHEEVANKILEGIDNEGVSREDMEKLMSKANKLVDQMCEESKKISTSTDFNKMTDVEKNEAIAEAAKKNPAIKKSVEKMEAICDEMSKVCVESSKGHDKIIKEINECTDKINTLFKKGKLEYEVECDPEVESRFDIKRPQLVKMAIDIANSTHDAKLLQDIPFKGYTNDELLALVYDSSIIDMKDAEVDDYSASIITAEDTKPILDKIEVKEKSSFFSKLESAKYGLIGRFC